MNFARPKIVLICMDLHREFSMLELLKKELEASLKVDVWIIGSLADIQKTYYLLNQIKPDMVFISQIIENVTRDIASYVRKSGAILCVLPVELYYLKNELRSLFDKQSYDRFVDYVFLPGLKMYRAIVKYSDINKNKIFITGSPKIDLFVNKQAEKVLSRKEFCQKFSINRERRNIFIFTSFILTPLSYAKNEEAFRGQLNFILKRNQGTYKTRDIFIRDIKRLCNDFPECNIILKLHPLENNSVYRKISAKNLHVVDNSTFNDTLNSIDLAVYWRSTVATECWLNGIKTLQYVPVNDHESLQSDFTKENPVYYHYLDLKKGVSKYLINNLEKKYLSFQKEYLKLNYYKTDGLSVKRIAAKIKKILHSINNNSLNYRFANNKMFYLFIIAEMIFGVRLSRRTVAIFNKGYCWSYTANNYVFDPPSSHRKRKSL